VRVVIPQSGIGGREAVVEHITHALTHTSHIHGLKAVAIQILMNARDIQ